MSDLINREFTIGVLLVGCPSDPEDAYGFGYEDGLRYAIHKIKHIPSAEPEIIRCEDCSHWKKLITGAHKCSILRWLTNPEDFCSFCAKERKNNEIN